jgi:CRP-like cAMP-binding protein
MAQPRTLPLTLVVRRGGRAASQGTPTGGIWIVQRGVLLAERIVDDGARWAFLLGPRDALGEPPGVDSAVDITALRPCLLRAVPLRGAARALATRGRSFTTVATMLATATVAERVRWVLADAAARFGRPGPEGRIVGLRMSQELIAALAGTTRESANRSLRVLERQGLVRRMGRGRYVLPTPIDPAGIARVG